MRPYRSSSNNPPFFSSRTGTWQCALYNRSFFFHQNIFFWEKGALPCAPTDHHQTIHHFFPPVRAHGNVPHIIDHFFFHQNIFFRKKGALPCAPIHHPITHLFLYYSLIFLKTTSFSTQSEKTFF